MNNRHRRVASLIKKHETPQEQWERKIRKLFIKFGESAEELALSIQKDFAKNLAKKKEVPNDTEV